MKITEISVTEAARNFAEYVNRVRYQNVGFVLLKNGKPVARMVPYEEKICTGKQLAEALRKVDLTAEEAKSWQHDLRAGRKILKATKDRWR